MSNWKVLSHDAFARHELVRRVSDNHSDCDWCGRQRNGSDNPRGLYQYGIRADDSGRVNEIRGLFCSVSCMRSYS